MTAVDDRPTVADGGMLLERLVTDGLPRPQHTRIRTDHGELTLSLTLADEDDFGLWVEQMESSGIVAPGPWQVGGLAFNVAVGRVVGVMTVVAVQVEPPVEAETEGAS